MNDDDTMGDYWRDVKQARRKARAEFGIPCPQCHKLQPKRDATILMPGQRCRVDGYQDQRPHIEDYQ